MVEPYLAGSTDQLIERGRQLLAIVQGRYAREYDGLRQICINKINAALAELRELRQETVIDDGLQSPRRVRVLKRVVAKLDAIESVGVMALSKASREEGFLNQLITNICSEIAYPHVTPTVTNTSRDYFCIYPAFNLLCVPLIEGRFLLHLADTYHELGHPLHHPVTKDTPCLEPYHKAYARALHAVVDYIRDQELVGGRERWPEELGYKLRVWRSHWIKYWMEEIFCDLFGALTAGPAFAWAHYHLSIKRGGNPFAVPEYSESTHPPDDARMRAILIALSGTGFENQVADIEAKWESFLGVMDYKSTPEYRMCFPPNLLGEVVREAARGVAQIGITTAKPRDMLPTIKLLNEAWDRFWESPSDFRAWEHEQVAILHQSARAS